MSGADKTFGLRDNVAKFNIENKEAKIKENNIITGDWEYVCTFGLWELILATTPNDKICTNGDYDNQHSILCRNNAFNKCLKEKQ